MIDTKSNRNMSPLHKLKDKILQNSENAASKKIEDGSAATNVDDTAN